MILIIESDNFRNFALMNKGESKYPKFLSNAPLGDDLFEGQSQKTIADCISELLLGDDSCKVIGIDGQWGSGKSNLVQIIQKSISDKYFTFVYDAWGHQEDLQRRSILEELTEALTSASVLNSKDWRDVKLKQLLARKRETKTETTPSLGVGIILTGLTLILTPLFSIIADAVPECLIWGRIGITAIPIGVLIICFLISWLKKGTPPKKAIVSLFHIYQGVQTENTTLETISEDEPSVKQFRNWMSEISKDLGEKRLLLVFDNMDRLPAEKVQELWSSIHTFFAETSYPNIRVIVPFDRTHIKTAFKSDSDDLQQCFGDDFINKTFNVVFRVSPPILSDWKNYFKLKWTEALGELDADEHDKVIQIFDTLCPNITPREIVAFINEYVSIKLASQNYVIPGRYIALFIYAKKQIASKQIVSKRDDEILNPTYLGNLAFLYQKDENLSQYIAALTYQIDPGKAIQVAYTRTLSTALDSNDSDTVLSISKVKEFPSILGDIISNLNNYENTILALAKVPDESLSVSIWDSIAAKISYVQCVDQKVKHFHLILIDKVSDKKTVVKKIIQDFYEAEIFVSLDFVESLHKIEEAYGVDVYNLLSEKKTEVGDFVKCLNKTKNDYAKYKITCPIKEVDHHLASLTIEQLAEISFIPYYDDDEKEKLTEYLGSLEAKRATAETKVNTLQILLTRLKELKQPIPQLISDSWIYNNFVVLKEDADSYSGLYYDLIAMRLARGNSFASAHVSSFAKVMNTDSDPFSEQVASRIECYIDFGSYLLGLEHFHTSPLYVNVARKIILNNYGVSRANIASLIFKFDNLVNWSGVKRFELLSRLNNWHMHLDGVTVKTILQIPIPFFEISFPNTEKYEIAKHCVDTAVAYLESLSEQDWGKAFREDNSYVFQLCNIVCYEFNDAATKAFDAILKEIASGESPITNKVLYNKRFEIITASGDIPVSKFNVMLDIFIKQGKITPELFGFFAEWLFEFSQLNKKGVLNALFPATVLGNDTCLNLIMQSKEKLPGIMARATKEEKEVFIDNVLSLKSTHRKKVFKDFLRYLKLDKLKRSRKKSKTQ